MKIEDAKSTIDFFLQKAQEMCDVAKIAARNSKSLNGTGFYANKFHSLDITLAQYEREISSLIIVGGLEVEGKLKFTPNIDALRSPKTKPSLRTSALKNLRSFCLIEVLPRVESLKANPLPETEQVLPMAVVKGTRGYIEGMVIQANGCYEHQWYDACAVMIRKLVETLIILLYETEKKEAEIQDSNGNFFMLSGLVDQILKTNHWNLGRETKQALPSLKSLGDRSAHNRHYMAKKVDVDKVLHGLRVVVDDLLHFAKMK